MEARADTVSLQLMRVNRIGLSSRVQLTYKPLAGSLIATKGHSSTYLDRIGEITRRKDERSESRCHQRGLYLATG